jgi:hypothetical protein
MNRSDRFQLERERFARWLLLLLLLLLLLPSAPLTLIRRSRSPTKDPTAPALCDRVRALGAAHVALRAARHHAHLLHTAPPPVFEPKKKQFTQTTFVGVLFVAPAPPRSAASARKPSNAREPAAACIVSCFRQQDGRGGIIRKRPLFGVDV